MYDKYIQHSSENIFGDLQFKMFLKKCLISLFIIIEAQSTNNNKLENNLLHIMFLKQKYSSKTFFVHYYNFTGISICH